MSTLIFGAQPDNLGGALAMKAAERGRYVMAVDRETVWWNELPMVPIPSAHVVTEFVNSPRQNALNNDITKVFAHWVRDRNDLEEPPRNLIVSLGLNKPDSDFRSVGESLDEHMFMNVTVPLEIVARWCRWTGEAGRATGLAVVIGSNSARVPRSPSVGYCASKAALHQGMAALARHMARKNSNTLVTLAPGFIEDTPMSQRTVQEHGVPHRMPIGTALQRADVVGFVDYLLDAPPAEIRMFHGVAVPMDANEF